MRRQPVVGTKHLHHYFMASTHILLTAPDSFITTTKRLHSHSEGAGDLDVGAFSGHYIWQAQPFISRNDPRLEYSCTVALLYSPSCGRIEIALVKPELKPIDIGADPCVCVWLSTL